MSVSQVSAGGWIEIRMPVDAWPVHISIDGGDKIAAFVDHVRGADGIQTWAKVRCPGDLRPGRHRVTAFADGATVDTVIRVI